MKILFGMMALVPVLLSPASAEEWNQWRGPNRNGTATNARLPEKWPAALPAPLWKARIGIGYSSPVVSNGRVFIMGRETDKQESCLCFDANTGQRLWRQTYGCLFVPPDPTAGKGPNSTPTVDRDRVYMLGLGGMFHCLDVKTGNILWKHDFQKEFWGVEKSPDGDDMWFPVCGSAASALVEGEQVIIPVGGKKAGALTAFDRKSGKILWQALPERSSYASPLLVKLADTPQYVGFTGLRMVGLDAKSHAVLWEHPFTAMFQQTIVTPVVWKDHVLVCGEAKPAVALKITRNGDKVEAKEAWKTADLSTYLVTPVLVKDHLIGLNQRSRTLVCIDTATGKTVWTSPRIANNLTLVVAGEQVLAQTEKGELIVFDASPKAYTERARWKVSDVGDVWAYLGVNGSRVYIKDKEYLTCYDFGVRK